MASRKLWRKQLIKFWDGLCAHNFPCFFCHLLYFILNLLPLSPYISIGFCCFFYIPFHPVIFQFIVVLNFLESFCYRLLSCLAFKSKEFLIQTLFCRYCVPAQFPPLFVLPHHKDRSLLFACTLCLPTSHFLVIFCEGPLGVLIFSSPLKYQ